MTELAAESEEGEWYQEWLVETGRVRKSDEEVEEKAEEKKDEENRENGKEVEVGVWGPTPPRLQNSFWFLLYLVVS